MTLSQCPRMTPFELLRDMRSRVAFMAAQASALVNTSADRNDQMREVQTKLDEVLGILDSSQQETVKPC